ncbi:hypothetical protein K1T71_013551 [Dendrolimus kikuchii]|uniref:Uncharacterized protein n=1 Tax=Dendrolimus kikuchii TaxID=765133 RepID=A0ACC1CGT1_9NEOP|nr:hypothetical protein K1T71_013551 [Dendrolimus kikuchii]
MTKHQYLLPACTRTTTKQRALISRFVISIESISIVWSALGRIRASVVVAQWVGGRAECGRARILAYTASTLQYTSRDNLPSNIDINT